MNVSEYINKLLSLCPYEIEYQGCFIKVFNDLLGDVPLVQYATELEIAANPEFWEESLYLPTVPLYLKAVTLALIMEPVADIEICKPIGAFDGKMVPRDLFAKIQFERLDPVLHELVYQLIILLWRPRNMMPGKGYFKSRVCSSLCQRGEYNKLVPALLWAAKRWRDEDKARLRDIGDRLSLDWRETHSDAELGFAKFLEIIEPDPVLLGEFVVSCVSYLKQVSRLDDRSISSKILASFWRKLPSELVLLDSGLFSRILIEQFKDSSVEGDIVWNIFDLFRKPEGFVWPDNISPSRDLLGLIGRIVVFERNYPEYKDMPFRRLFWQNLGSGLYANAAADLLEYSLGMAITQLIASSMNNKKIREDSKLYIDTTLFWASQGITALAAANTERDYGLIDHNAINLALCLIRAQRKTKKAFDSLIDPNETDEDSI